MFVFQKGKKKLARDERELINVLDKKMENFFLQRLNLESTKADIGGYICWIQCLDI